MKNSIQDILLQFERYSVLWNEANEKVEYKKGNRYFSQAMTCAKKLYEKKSLDNLLPFVTNDNVGVRFLAAFVLLPFHKDLCEMTLQEIAEGNNGIGSFDAKMTLQEWKKGNLVFPY